MVLFPRMYFMRYYQNTGCDMAFMKTSVGLTKAKQVNENALLSGMSDDQIKNLLQRYLDGKNIGFVPSVELLKKHGF